ncbi:WD repeat-containing protein 11 [Armadillidium vulgare]|nr:WD repeat-containing protein 11 [Armadillidium vulgare]
MAENEDENKTNHIAIPPTLQRVLPRVITGALSPQNKDALDWGWQGFIAYCAQATIIIVDPIKWRRTQHYHQLSAPYTLVLASADLNGVIYVWNVYQGDVVATLQDGNRQISVIFIVNV